MSMNRLVRKPSQSLLHARRNGLRWLFGSMVQDRREMIRCSVEDAARLAGMEPSEWAAIEAGHIPADPAKLRSMAAALEIRFDQMAMLVHLCQDAWAE
jgi:transcriptional regulator with XRE-family HTH domain